MAVPQEVVSVVTVPSREMRRRWRRLQRFVRESVCDQPGADNMPDDRIPKHTTKMWTAQGRQRVGKTALLNTAGQYFRGLGCEIDIWNADQQNRTHSLSTFFPDAATPPTGSLSDGKAWIEERLAEQVRSGRHALLDAGGGLTGFSALVDEIPLVGALGQKGVEVVGLFAVGPEQADLDYLERFADQGLFLPKATVIVLNAGLVLSGRSAASAFAAIRQNRTFEAAVAGGAQVIMLPNLSCMSQVTDRGLTFAQAAAGQAKPGQEPLSFFDQARVNRWWTRDIPAFFGQFPPEWLPTSTLPAQARLSS